MTSCGEAQRIVQAELTGSGLERNEAGVLDVDGERWRDGEGVMSLGDGAAMRGEVVLGKSRRLVGCCGWVWEGSN